MIIFWGKYSTIFKLNTIDDKAVKVVKEEETKAKMEEKTEDRKVEEKLEERIIIGTGNRFWTASLLLTL